jgi:NAD(P)-dependent dehydrogenase (short-subunit alcohol dehydrogenase family)
MPKGKTAIVTGSTSGIGLGIARALAGDGCNVMLNGFGETVSIETEREHIARDFGVRVTFNPADLSKSAEVVQMIEAATHELGQVDILVNNAGIQHTASIESFPGRPLGCCYRNQPVVKLSRDSCRHPADAQAQLGPHHQRRFDPRACGVRGEGSLRSRQTRRAWID